MGGYPSAISTSYGTGMYTYTLCSHRIFSFKIVYVFLHHLHPFITKKKQPQRIKFLYRCIVFVLQFQVYTNI